MKPFNSKIQLNFMSIIKEILIRLLMLILSPVIGLLFFVTVVLIATFRFDVFRDSWHS